MSASALKVLGSGASLRAAKILPHATLLLNDIPAVFKRIFLGVGLLGLTVAAVAYVDSRRFLDAAIAAPGQVVDVQVIMVKRRNSHLNEAAYIHLVCFPTRDGRIAWFWSPRQGIKRAVGSTLEVLYLPGDPSSAMSREFTSPWAITIVMGMTGGVFASAGALIYLLEWWSTYRRRNLMRNGVPVRAKVMRVIRDQGTYSRGMHPFIIICSWRDPETSKLHTFRSRNLWVDPSRHMIGQMLDVYIASGNPGNHYVDVSFLPRH